MLIVVKYHFQLFIT